MKNINIRINHLEQNQEIAAFMLNKEEKEMLGILQRNNYCQLILVERGKGSRILDVIRHDIMDNSLYLVLPNQAHQMQFENETTGMILNFSIDCLAISPIDLHLLTEQGAFSLGCSEVVHIKQLMQDVYRYYNSRNHVTDKKIALNYLSILLLKLIGKQIRKDVCTNLTDSMLFKKFSSFLEENFEIERTVENYWRYLGVSYNKLNAVVKQKTGKTVLQQIHSRLMLEIKILLTHTELSQKEISYKLNFDSTSTFNQFVKKQTLMTPNELKLKLLKD